MTEPQSLRWKICWWVALKALRLIDYGVCIDCGKTFEAWNCGDKCCNSKVIKVCRDCDCRLTQPNE